MKLCNGLVAVAAMALCSMTAQAGAFQTEYSRTEATVLTEGFQGNLREFFFYRQTGRCGAAPIAPRGEYETEAEYDQRRTRHLEDSEARCQAFEIIIPWTLNYDVDRERFSIDFFDLFREASQNTTYQIGVAEEAILFERSAPVFEWREARLRACLNQQRNRRGSGVTCRQRQTGNCQPIRFETTQSYLTGVEISGSCTHYFSRMFVGSDVLHRGALRLDRTLIDLDTPSFARSPVISARRLRDIEPYLFIRIQSDIHPLLEPRPAQAGFIETGEEDSTEWVSIRAHSIEFFRSDTGETIAVSSRR